MTALNKEHRPLNLSPRDQIEIKAHDLCEALDHENNNNKI